MKIKRKVQLNLPQLIEWAWENPKSSRNKRFVSENKDFPYVNQYVIFNEVGYAEIESSYCYGRNDLFTITTEEEITEDKWFPELVIRTVAGDYRLHKQGSINDFKHSTFNDVEAFYIPNDDLTMTLIWRDGKMVE